MIRTLNHKVSRLAAALALIAATSTLAHAALIHRYSFTDGAKDSVGKVDGTLKGAGATIVDGKLVLKNDGKSSSDPGVSYLQFAGSLLPKSGSVSIVTWFTCKEVADYARIINFGHTENGEGSQFIYSSPHTADGSSRAAITAADVGSKTFIDNDGLDDGKPHMMAIVIDGAAKKLHVYIDGKEPHAAEDLGDNTLDKVDPTSNWIGRSSFDNDAGLTGSIDEIRVYDHALSAAEVEAADKAGPDKVPEANPVVTSQPAK